MQVDQRRALLGEEHHARGVAVEAMDELEELRLGPRRPHLLDQAGGDPAAAVHREAGRLVDDDDRSSSNRIGTRRARDGRRAVDGSATRIGGTRTTSPMASRASGPTRPLLTRTSPLRRIR